LIAMHSGRALTTFLAIAGAVLVWTGVHYGRGGGATAAAPGDGMTIRFFRNPATVAAFSAADLDGRSVSSDLWKGKVIIVNFWATWCPPCLEEMPAMERLYRQHREVGFTLVAVSVDADSKLVAPFVTAHKLTFPVALDPSMSMANTYGVRALPSTFIVARDGTLAALAIGPRHWDNDAAHSLIEGLAR
jgi:peroxiredoxin